MKESLSEVVESAIKNGCGSHFSGPRLRKSGIVLSDPVGLCAMSREEAKRDMAEANASIARLVNAMSDGLCVGANAIRAQTTILNQEIRARMAKAII